MILGHTSAFDLVVTDYHMPKMDGLEMTKRIQEAIPDLPVIMITAYCEDERLKNFSADRFSLLGKPVKPNILSSHILKIQNKSAANSSARLRD